MSTTPVPLPDDRGNATPRYRGRFAPSPTGPLHFGSLLAAFGGWLFARRAGGDWLIRIEDLDPPREVAGIAEMQLRTLEAFGLVSDEQVVRQSARHDRYTAAIERLRATGFAFDCACSRTDLGPDNGIHRRCRKPISMHTAAGSAERRPAVRLRVADDSVVAFEDAIQGPVSQRVDREVGDVVLRRADGFWAYQLAVVVDDAEQGITDVVRGADLLDSTPRQILLQRALGLPTPRYAHLPLVVDASGAKLSKSIASLPIDGRDPLPSLALAWRALGQAEAVFSGLSSVEHALAKAVLEFDPSRIPTGNIAFAALHNTPVSDGA